MTCIKQKYFWMFCTNSYLVSLFVNFFVFLFRAMMLLLLLIAFFRLWNMNKSPKSSMDNFYVKITSPLEATFSTFFLQPWIITSFVYILETSINLSMSDLVSRPVFPVTFWLLRNCPNWFFCQKLAQTFSVIWTILAKNVDVKIVFWSNELLRQPNSLNILDYRFSKICIFTIELSPGKVSRKIVYILS